MQPIAKYHHFTHRVKEHVAVNFGFLAGEWSSPLPNRMWRHFLLDDSDTKKVPGAIGVFCPPLFQTDVVQLIDSHYFQNYCNTYNALVDCECCIYQSTKKIKQHLLIYGTIVLHSEFEINFKTIEIYTIMCQSNQNFNIPPPRANLGYLLSLAGEWRIWPLPQQGGENRTGSGSFQRFFFVPETLTAINTYFNEMEDFKGRDIAVS